MMVRLCLMASHGCLPGLVIKDCLPIFPSSVHGTRQEISISGSPNLKLHQEPWSPMSGLPETSKLDKFHPTLSKPLLIEVRDTGPDSILFSHGIAEKCTRHEEILQLLNTGSVEVEKGKLDLSLLSDMMGPQGSRGDVIVPSVFKSSLYDAEGQPSLVQPIVEFFPEKFLVDFVGDLVFCSKILVGQDGQVSFSGSRTETKDLLSIVAEFYLSKNPTVLRKQSVVPYFYRKVSKEARDLVSPKVAPLPSPEKVKQRAATKKSSAKAVKEKDLHRKNYFHACECLLSLMMNNRRDEKMAVLSLKKSGPEVPELLTQISAGIAGTGLAVLISVVCKVACAKVPFSTSKLFNTGIGLALVWLSASVNRLRDTIVPIIKNSGKFGLEEEMTMKKVDKSIQEILFRAAALMAVTALRFA